MELIGFRRFSAGAAALLLVVLGGCGEPKFSGVVHDNFGRAVDGVVVAIAGTGFTTTTDFLGAFALTAKRADVIVTFTKEGYQPERIPVDASAGGALTLGDVVLYKTISQNGIFLVGNDNYIGPIQTCQINIIMVRENVEVGYDRITAGGTDPALINIAEVAIPVTLVENFDVTSDLRVGTFKHLFERYDRPEIGRVTFATTPEVSSREVPIRQVETGARFGRWLETGITGIGTYALAVPDPSNGLPRPGAVCYLFQLR